MGLDMYLTAEKFIFADDARIRSALRASGFNSKDKHVRSISVDIMTWRKSNQIHQWFVDNVQDGEDDCRRYFVSLEKLQALVVLCQRVSQDHALAKELLPIQEGFFFGSDEYDDMYFFDLHETLEYLLPIFKDRDWVDWDFYYQSSW